MPRDPCRGRTATDKAGNVGSGSTTFTIKVTFANLVNLVKEFDTKSDLAAIMVATLEGAQAASNVHAAWLVDAILGNN